MLPAWKTCVCILSAILVSCVASSAATVLLVDVSDPSAVKISSSGANADADSDNVPEAAGIDLLRFFTGAVNMSVMYVNSSSLTPSGGNAYSNFEGDDYSGSLVDLNLISSSLSAMQNFSTTTPAFTGEAYLDLSGFTAFLPTFGTSGNILVGANMETYGTVIGQWQAVPEPQTYALIAMGLVGIYFVRRRAARA